MNLALALLCLNVVFLVGIERTDVFTGCVVVAALLHFFLLAGRDAQGQRREEQYGASILHNDKNA